MKTIQELTFELNQTLSKSITLFEKRQGLRFDWLKTITIEIEQLEDAKADFNAEKAKPDADKDFIKQYEVLIKTQETKFNSAYKRVTDKYKTLSIDPNNMSASITNSQNNAKTNINNAKTKIEGKLTNSEKIYGYTAGFETYMKNKIASTKTDEEYVEEYISDYAGFLDIYAKRGETTVSQGSLLSNTEYYAFVFGFEQYTRTTGITKVKFTTRQAGNPEDLAFTFTTSNATAGSVDVRIEGTPDNALYYWDIVAASATQEETSEILEARIQRWLDKGVYTDRVTVFQKRGSRGIVETTATTHDSGYALIEPGKEYKLYAVGIYEETGEYATDFVFSEPFTTPAN